MLNIRYSVFVSTYYQYETYWSIKYPVAHLSHCLCFCLLVSLWLINMPWKSCLWVQNSTQYWGVPTDDHYCLLLYLRPPIFSPWQWHPKVKVVSRCKYLQKVCLSPGSGCSEWPWSLSVHPSQVSHHSRSCVHPCPVAFEQVLWVCHRLWSTIVIKTSRWESTYTKKWEDRKNVWIIEFGGVFTYRLVQKKVEETFKNSSSLLYYSRL